MDYKSIIKGLLNHCHAVGACNLPAEQPQLHITIDGKTDCLTRDILDLDSIELVLLDSDLALTDLFDTSNVSHDGFSPFATLHYPTDWKLIELVVNADGMLLLVFMNQKPDSYQLDDQGNISSYELELIPFGIPSERLCFLIDAMNHSWQYIITQEFDPQEEHIVTNVLEIHDGRKLALYCSHGGKGTNRSPSWYLTHYCPESLNPNLPRPLQK